MVESSKAGRLADQGGEELKGLGDVATKTRDKIIDKLPDGNPMGMEDKNGKNWGE